MSDGQDAAEKPHEPTPAKLEELRKKGEVPRSQEVSGLMVFAAVLLGSAAFGAAALQHTAVSLTGFFDLVPLAARKPTGTALLWPRSLAAVAPIWGILALAALAVVLGAVVQRSVVFAPDRLRPKLSRISVLKNAKNKFGPSGLFEFAKSAVKMAIFAAVLGLMMAARRDRILGSLSAEPAQILAEMLRFCLDFLLVTVAVMAVIAVIDLLWQRHDFLNKNRMSRKEIADEMKQNEGDPYMKSERRRRAQEISQNQMMRDVAKADVVVVNPTHFAVALAWDRGRKGSAPACVAKGTDEVAAAIRERATEERVPIFSDPPTARLLFAEVEIGQEIQVAHFEAVAAAIRFADKLREKGRKT